MAQTFKLRESIGLPAEIDLDEEAGLLRGVKILGLTSQNGKRYSPQAIKGALPLLEQARVFIDHGLEDDQGRELPRKVGDRFGRLKEVTQNPAGEAVGTLQFNPKHPRAASFCWFAKNDPAGIGMSIVGYGNGTKQSDGIKLVEQITKIISVDIVDGPATTMGLYEQEGFKASKDPQAEAQAHAQAAAAHATAAQAAVAGAGASSGATSMDKNDTGAAGAEGGDDFRAKLADLAQHVVSDSSMSRKDCLKKLRQITAMIEEGETGEGEGGESGDMTAEKCAEQLRNFSHPAAAFALKEITTSIETKRCIALREQAKTAGVPDVALTPKFLELLLKEQTADGVTSLIADRVAVSTPSRPTPKYTPRVDPETPKPFDAKAVCDALFTQDDGE